MNAQSSNVTPAPESVADVLRQEPSCSRADTSASGRFVGTSHDEQAYLLSCGATRRVVIESEHVIVARLDVSEDTLEDAGDLDLDGRHELLLIGHAGPKVTIRALRADGGRLESVYVFSATRDPCVRLTIYYRFVKPSLEFREDTAQNGCPP